MDEALKTFIEMLDNADDDTTCFVVEGKNDLQALHAFGVRHLQKIDTQLYLFCERVANNYRRVVILTDLDTEGKKLYKQLKNHFSQLGVFIDDRPREALWKTTIRQVEGLFSYANTTQRQNG